MSAVTLTKGEFNRFWDEVLGNAWFIDEWDANDDTFHDRDVNAAINILAAGLAVSACGDGVRPART